MEWIEGVKLTDERGLRRYGMKAVDFVDLGVDCTMRQLLEHGKSDFRITIFWHLTCSDVRGSIHAFNNPLQLCLGFTLDITCSHRSVCILSYLVRFGISFNSGYFHADPHPGNILATRAGELVYLDFGMMSEAPLSAR